MPTRKVQIGKWELFKFLLTRVPTVLWAGIRLEHIDESKCAVSMRRNRRNRNPFDGIYFANIMTGAEMASGLLLFDEIRDFENRSSARFVAVIQHAEADFVRPITARAELSCVQGNEIRHAVFDAIAQGRTSITTLVTARNERGKRAADIRITWHIRCTV